MTHDLRPTDPTPRPSPAADRGQPPPEAGALLPTPRRQPPLREVLKGLEARELEGQTVFDQLFGPTAED